MQGLTHLFCLNTGPFCLLTPPTTSELVHLPLDPFLSAPRSVVSLCYKAHAGPETCHSYSSAAEEQAELGQNSGWPQARCASGRLPSRWPAFSLLCRC